MDEKLVANAKEELTKAIDHLAAYFLKDEPFICGDEISVADLVGVCELMHLDGVNESGIYENNPIVKSWMKRVEDRMQPHFDEASISLKGLKKMFNEAKA